MDSYADFEPAPLSIGPDGAPQLGALGLPPPIPAATPQNFVCLRGPCRFYWQMETFMSSGNPAATWGPDGLKDESGHAIRAPRQILRTCLAHPGTETELTEDCVFDCNLWDPLTTREVKRREKRRSKYLKLHPDHFPPPMLELDAEIDDHDDEED